MKLIDGDKLISDLNNPDLCNVTPRILEIISEQPTVKPSVNPLNILENKASNSTDAVNHPSHYSNGKYECIEVMKEVFGVEKVKAFCELNAFKYMWRSNKKNGTEDLKKARFYTDYLIKMEGADNEH